MTVLGTRPTLRHGAQVLGDRHVPEALRLCAANPVAAVLASARLIPASRCGLVRSSSELWGYVEGGRLVAACLVSANLVPVAPGLDPAARSRAMAALAILAVQRRRAYSSLVGPTELVMDLWQHMSAAGRMVARDVRPDQPSMLIDREPLVDPDPAVRRSRSDELDIVLPACVNMFTEEVGYSPMTAGGTGYTTRVRTLVAQGRSFVRVEADRGRPRVIFKAELAASGFGVSQVQGVWVVPDRRGAGLSEPGMAAVVDYGRATADPVVSLYVNSYNTRAIAAYEAVGFRQVGTYATVQL
ncbi:MAG: GNAT family N-acetyltransferase [Micrococcales bacterium]|nr:GNAT family N-acetyltransferase [Micrococcales bacterium]